VRDQEFVCVKCRRVQTRPASSRKCDVKECHGDLRTVPSKGLEGVSFLVTVHFPAAELALLSPEQITALFEGIAMVQASGKPPPTANTPPHSTPPPG